MIRLLSFLLLLGGLAGPLYGNAYQYQLSWDNPADHIYEMHLRVTPESGGHTDFQVPAWRPGRYIIQHYAAGISGFRARTDQYLDLAWEKTDVDTWRVQNPQAGDIHVHYRFYANFMDAGSSVLNADQAYFNPVNFFMHVRDRYAWPCTLSIESLPEGWKIATGLAQDPARKGRFFAEDYHEMVDCPVVCSPTLKTLHAQILGKNIYAHFQGKFPNDKATEDHFQMAVFNIVTEQAALFGDLPLDEYHFIYQLLPYPYFHAVEHHNSSVYALPDARTTSPEEISEFFSVTSHEFFHLYNVKRIRPAAMWPYNYQERQPTALHWWTEGVTDYYADLVLARTGVMARDDWYDRLASTCASLDNNYASQTVSPEQSSFNSWLAPSNYSPPYHRISYYTQGTRLGWLLDLDIRATTQGEKSLDDVFRTLYREYYQQGKGLGENDLPEELRRLTGKSYADFFTRYVAGTQKVDYRPFLEPFGLQLTATPDPGNDFRSIGVTRISEKDRKIVVRTVLPGSDAARGGLTAGMLITTINGGPAEEFDAEAFFSQQLKIAMLEMEVEMRDGSTRDLHIEWTRSWFPVVYDISEMPTMSAAQRKLLDGWLASVRG